MLSRSCCHTDNIHVATYHREGSHYVTDHVSYTMMTRAKCESLRTHVDTKVLCPSVCRCLVTSRDHPQEIPLL